MDGPKYSHHQLNNMAKLLLIDSILRSIIAVLGGHSERTKPKSKLLLQEFSPSNGNETSNYALCTLCTGKAFKSVKCTKMIGNYVKMKPYIILVAAGTERWKHRINGIAIYWVDIGWMMQNKQKCTILVLRKPTKQIRLYVVLFFSLHMVSSHPIVCAPEEFEAYFLLSKTVLFLYNSDNNLSIVSARLISSLEAWKPPIKASRL